MPINETDLQRHLLLAGKRLKQAAAEADNLDQADELRRAGTQLRKAARAIEIPIDPPNTAGVLLGLACDRADTSNAIAWAQAAEQYEAGGRFPDIRVTYTPGQPLFPDHPHNQFLGARYLSISIKTLSQTRAREFVRSIPPELRPWVLVTIWHEPGDNIENDQFTWPAWIAMQEALADEGRKLGVTTCANLMEWAWRDPDPIRDPEHAKAGITCHPLFSFDVYQEANRQLPPASLIDPVVDTITSWGMATNQIWIRETGVKSDDADIQAAWWTDLHAYAEEHDFWAVAPWDSHYKGPSLIIPPSIQQHIGATFAD